jgi:hypothetical protein
MFGAPTVAELEAPLAGDAAAPASRAEVAEVADDKPQVP